MKSAGVCRERVAGADLGGTRIPVLCRGEGGGHDEVSCVVQVVVCFGGSVAKFYS